VLALCDVGLKLRLTINIVRLQSYLSHLTYSAGAWEKVPLSSEKEVGVLLPFFLQDSFFI
jgi:hypothetical protein